MALRGSFTPHGGGKPESAWDPSREDLPACVTLWVEPPDPHSYTIELQDAESGEHGVQRARPMEVHEGRSKAAVLPEDLGPCVRLLLRSTDPQHLDGLYFLRKPPDPPRDA
jgi:hypothetical protein